MKLKNKLNITCDGGAATGKSTGAKLIAKKYKLAFMSSGLLYRYVGYLILKYNPKNKVNFINNKFKKLNYKNLNKINLHTQKISAFTAIIAKNPKIRNILKKYQINFVRKNSGCVLEGRDSSTKILPSSDVKFFFICNLNIAAKRRFKELKKKGSKNIKLKDVKEALRARNITDKQRSISPLQKHPLAIIVNSGKLNINSMVGKMSFHIENILKKKYG